VALVVAFLAASAFLAVAFSLLRGERLVSSRLHVDRSRLAERAPLAEVVLAGLAVGRLANQPSAAGVGFLLLSVGVAASARGASRTAAAALGLLGALGAVAAVGELITRCGGDALALVVVGLAVTLVLLTLTVRRTLSGWWCHDLGLGPLGLGVFAIAELAPVAVAPSGAALLTSSMPWWHRLALVTALLTVAVIVGVAPRFGAELVAIALAVVTFGLSPWSTTCGLHPGAALAAVGMALALHAVARPRRGRRVARPRAR
jgi:hypothetical protein